MAATADGDDDGGADARRHRANGDPATIDRDAASGSATRRQVAPSTNARHGDAPSDRSPAQGPRRRPGRWQRPAGRDRVDDRGGVLDRPEPAPRNGSTGLARHWASVPAALDEAGLAPRNGSTGLARRWASLPAAVDETRAAGPRGAASALLARWPPALGAAGPASRNGSPGLAQRWASRPAAADGTRAAPPHDDAQGPEQRSPPVLRRSPAPACRDDCAAAGAGRHRPPWRARFRSTSCRPTWRPGSTHSRHWTRCA